MASAGNKTNKQRTQVQLVRNDSHLPRDWPELMEPLASKPMMTVQRIHIRKRAAAKTLGGT